MVLADWEFSGIMGNSAIDLASWTFLYGPTNWLAEHEEALVAAHWEGLIAGGVDPEEYFYEQAKHDYLIYGSTIIATRYVSALTTDQRFFNHIDDWFTRHDLTPDMMVAPVYAGYDAFV